MTLTPLSLFLACPPGLEPFLAAEAQAPGFEAIEVAPGGVAVAGGWAEVRRANLRLRGATRVLARIAQFRALHLAQLDKRCRRIGWADILPSGAPLTVEATCRASKIYHDRAAAARLSGAVRDALGPATEGEEPLRLLLRIEDDLATISLDTSGEPLHRRGHKQAVGKAPLRETLAAPFLAACGYDGTDPALDPMCGSGTSPLEAAEIAAGLAPGRSRTFAFERPATHDPAAWKAERSAVPRPLSDHIHRGVDRDQGAIAGATANAERAGLADRTAFARAPISALERPEGPPGLVMVNPPYGARIGDRKLLFALYGSLGQVLRERFSGWRVGLVTSDGGLARATGLPFGPAGPTVPHGGLTITLWRTGPLP